jgi:hypothetical protein
VVTCSRCEANVESKGEVRSGRPARAAEEEAASPAEGNALLVSFILGDVPGGGDDD